jgi:hypothetical protein
MASIATWLRTFGIDPRRTLRSALGLSRYLSMARDLRKSGTPGFAWAETLPILDEWGESSGTLGAYFFQDQLVARWIFEASPERHFDVGSRIDGFIGSLSVFREVDAIDLRPQPVCVHNVRFHELDLMQELPAEWIGKTESLSCLHTIEHFGLGRYGDTVDPEGHLKGLSQLKKMVAPGGVIYLSTPIGPQRIEYNAHRVFSAITLRDWFADGWTIERFAVIGDTNTVRENLDPHDPEIENHFGCHLGVGIVAARKKPSQPI